MSHFKTLERQGLYFAGVKATDGTWQPRLLLQRSVDLLTDLGRPSEEIREALDTVPEGSTTEAEWLTQVKSWMAMLSNFQKTQKAADWKPTGAHGTQLWNNWLKFDKAPAKVYPTFTGGYLHKSHVTIWTDAEGTEREPAEFLFSGEIDLRKYEGQEVAIVRLTPAELPRTLTDPSESDTAEKVAKWLLLATMDSGGTIHVAPEPEETSEEVHRSFEPVTVPTVSVRTSTEIGPGQVPEELFGEVYTYAVSGTVGTLRSVTNLYDARPYLISCKYLEDRYLSDTSSKLSTAFSRSARIMGDTAIIMGRDLRFSNTGMDVMTPVQYKPTRSYTDSDETLFEILPMFVPQTEEQLAKLIGVLSEWPMSDFVGGYRNAILGARRIGIPDIPVAICPEDVGTKVVEYEDWAKPEDVWKENPEMYTTRGNTVRLSVIFDSVRVFPVTFTVK